MRARRITWIAGLVTVVTWGVAVLVAVLGAPERAAAGNTGPRAAAHRFARAFERETARVPLSGRGIAAACRRTAAVPAQGRTCRTADGLFALADAPRGYLTHGPDLVDARPRSAASTAARVGDRSDVVCSSRTRSRHVLLAYLVPSDHASGGSGVRGDRFDTVVPQLRQAFYDASAMVDARAGELASGARRRIRVACDVDGEPTVIRVVLPRTAAAYRGPTAGFGAIIEDLDALGLLPANPDYQRGRVTGLRRLLAYYDADFVPGVAGQGTMYRRSTLLKQGVSTSSPLVGRTVRNINNTPPQASVAIQYGTSHDSVTAEPPEATALLHELSHTMGAVQDDVPTSTRGGHCTDGLDVMCYDDGGPSGAQYDELRCPDPGASTGAVPTERERYDCNGDTYFHPAPPLGNPLAGATVWQLGLPANQTFATAASDVTGPGAVAGLRVRGAGTSLQLSWTAPSTAPRPVAYEVTAVQRVGALGPDQTFVTRSAASPVLRPFTTYDLDVRAIDATGSVGPATVLRRRTGPDTSPPSIVARPFVVAQRRAGIRVRWMAARDNVAVAAYRVEQRVGSAWRRIATVRSPGSGARTVTSPWLVLPSRTYQLVRVRAVDRRGLAPASGVATRIAVP